jgi:hypothetical protein
VQYTAHEVRSGLVFWAFAQCRSAAAGRLRRIPISTRIVVASACDLAWQTDNRVEFLGSYDRKGQRSGFLAALGDLQHLRIPPAAHT